MPPWTVEELVIASVALHIKSPNEIRSRYTIAGGIARLVLRNVEPAATAVNRAPTDACSDLVYQLTVNAARCDGAQLRNLFTESDKPSLLQMYSNAGPHIGCLVHLHVITDDSEEAYDKNAIYYRPASKFAHTLVVNQFIKQIHESQEIIALKWLEGKVGRSYLGLLQEELLHRAISAGGTFLVQDFSDKKLYKLKFAMRERTNFIFLSHVNSDSTQYYYIPEAKNYPAIDAIVTPFVCLQMTISKNHPINFNAIEKIMKHLLKVCE